MGFFKNIIARLARFGGETTPKNDIRDRQKEISEELARARDELSAFHEENARDWARRQREEADRTAQIVSEIRDRNKSPSVHERKIPN